MADNPTPQWGDIAPRRESRHVTERAEFDPGEMSGRESLYFSVRRNPPKPLSACLLPLLGWIDAERQETEEQEAEAARLASLPYDAYLETDWWRAMRDVRMGHDRYRCVVCGIDSNLQVHHRTYERLGHELLEDLETLCDKCHTLKHAEGRAR